MKKENKRLQKIIAWILVIICFVGSAIIDKLFAQPYIGLGVTNKGANYSAGVLAENVDFKLSYQMPFTRNDNKRITSFSIGRQFVANEKYAITPAIGYGYRTWKNFDAYDNDPSGKTPIQTMTDFKPLIGLDIGINSHAGSLFTFVNYCGNVYVGIGLRVYPGKL